MTFRDLLSIILAATFVGVVVFAKYDQARRAEERKEHKADIETLFGGKK